MKVRRLRADLKLFFSYVVLTTAVIAALTIGVGWTLRGSLVEMAAGDLRRELLLARSVYEASPALPPDSVADWIGNLANRRTTIIDASGTVLGDSEFDDDALARLANHAGRKEIREAREGRVGRSIRLSSSVGVRHLYLAVPAAQGRIIRLAVPLSDVDRTVARVQRAIVAAGSVALVFAALLALGFTLVVTRPLHRVAAVARVMAAGDLSRRIGAPYQDELGELTDALDTLADELQRRLAQLEGERAEMQALIDAMTEGVLALGPQGEVRRANPAARRIFDLPENPRGMLPHEVARRPAFLDLVKQALAGEAVPSMSFTKDERHLLGSAQPLADGGTVMVFLDVSELRRLEGVRRDFVANASHELKTPLTAIRGFSETLLDDDLPPALRRQFAKTIQTHAERLQRIVDDLLDLSRLESGGWRANPEVVSLSEAAREAWALCQARENHKPIELELAIPADGEFVSADPSALRQIFTNLFSNALRYTPEGGAIAVTALPSPPSAMGHVTGGCGTDLATGSGWVSIAVADTGAGVPAVHLPRIFERFYRADAARSRAEGGTGLGLAIVRHLVEAHGGRAEADSELGRGTTICFTLPLAVPEHSEDFVTHL